MENSLIPAEWHVTARPSYGGEWFVEIKAPTFRAVAHHEGTKDEAIARFVGRVQSLGY